MNILSSTERVVSENNKRIIYDAFETYFFVTRNGSRTKIRLADCQIGENVYDEKNNLIGYVPDDFDYEAGVQEWMNS